MKRTGTQGDDLMGLLSSWLIEHELIRPSDWQAAEQELRRTFGGKLYYLRRRAARPADHLNRLAALPPDAKPAQRRAATGLGESRTRELTAVAAMLRLMPAPARTGGDDDGR